MPVRKARSRPKGKRKRPAPARRGGPEAAGRPRPAPHRNLVVAEITRSRALMEGDLGVFLDEVTRIAARSLGAERVAVWRIDGENSPGIRCLRSYDASRDAHGSGGSLDPGDASGLVRALEEERSVAAAEAAGDPRTCGLRETYLGPRGVRSLLAAPWFERGRIAGFVWHEHAGPARQWTDEEESFAISIAHFVSLANETAARRRALETLHRMSECSAETGRAFFNSLVRTLCELLKVDYALIAELSESAARVSRTIAVWGHGAPQENIEYGLDGTPCENVATGRICFYREGVAARFPRDLLLTQMGVDSYMGAPLRSPDGRTVGLMVVLHSGPIDETLRPDEILQTFVGRAESELSRLQSERSLRESEQLLEQRVRQRTQDLESVNRELEAFSYSVSHDLRAPLRSIHGFSRALQEDAGARLGDSEREHLDRITGAAARMGRLIDDLLNLSRVSRQDLRSVEVDLSALAASIAEDLKKRGSERSANFRIEPGLRAHGDPGLLRVVMENLLSNAWKFSASRDPAEIEFGAAEAGGETEYFVRDNGVGFDPRYVDKLFQPFQRLHPDGSFEGTGIGLATVLRAIRRHGGTARAESRPEEGAVFTFTLPG